MIECVVQAFFSYWTTCAEIEGSLPLLSCSTVEEDSYADPSARCVFFPVHA